MHREVNLETYGHAEIEALFIASYSLPDPFDIPSLANTSDAMDYSPSDGIDSSSDDPYPMLFDPTLLADPRPVVKPLDNLAPSSDWAIGDSMTFGAIAL